MKKLSIINVTAMVACLTVSIAVAGGTTLLNQLGSPGSWSVTYVQFGSASDRWIADDFTPEFDCTVESFSCQLVLDGGDSLTSGTFELRIYADRLSDEPVWEISLPAEDLDITATGDLFSARRVYLVNVELDPSDLFNAYSGTTYWFAWRMQDELDCRNLTVNANDSNDSWAWRYEDESWCEIGTDANAAFCLGGTQPSDVCTTSFGYIKALFR
ncbi:MAG: hypothetical protein A2Y64_07445 [Candidatus Coatesbacteria bacterium RBG_13_66_14]|uniref:Uncharacterized protein n=1 Tax=Candidatus Coatesbacteria bacterium RBG_13_66_14 TaxID=1817816 RepID=A0A1F5F720_9BACT|nr:MAG: hypothetical protein A2Y64_07445 [Candidatus Coatesbacteria bacterium RBG_13_66_14]